MQPPIDRLRQARSEVREARRATIQECIRLRREGWTIRALVQRYGVSMPRLYKWFREGGAGELIKKIKTRKERQNDASNSQPDNGNP